MCVYMLGCKGISTRFFFSISFAVLSVCKRFFYIDRRKKNRLGYLVVYYLFVFVI